MYALIGVAGGLALFGIVWVIARHTSARETWGRTKRERTPDELAALSRKRPIYFAGGLVVTVAVVLPLVLLTSH